MRNNILVVLWVTLLLSTAVLAQEFPMKSSAQWKGTLTGQGSGDCAIQTEDSRTCRLLLHANGLKPNGTYSFWCLDSSDQPKGLGPEPYTAQADARGEITYKPVLNFCPDTRSLQVVVRYEEGPSRSIRVLQGTLSKQ